MCIFTMLTASMELPVFAVNPEGRAASVFGYTLNDEISKYGVISTEESGGYVEMNCSEGVYPTGVIYADIIDFNENESPNLVIFRADAARGCISADIYGYDEEKETAKLITIISKGCNLEDGVTAAMVIGYNESKRYIVYNEYIDNTVSASEYYTIIDGEAVRYVDTQQLTGEAGVVSYSNIMCHPEIDVSEYNMQLDDFFTGLKNSSAQSVSYNDMADSVVLEEETKMEKVLTRAASLSDFDINRFKGITEYNEAMEAPYSEDIFYSITNMYDLGDQIYYIRFATDNSFYNYAFLRRTSTIEEGYQLLKVKNDTIPLCESEISEYKNKFLHNNLVYKKARGNIEEKEKTGFSIKMFKMPKPIKVPKLIDRRLRKPIALISGGICLALFTFLWIYMASEEETDET